MKKSYHPFFSLLLLAFVFIGISGCVPVPVSTTILHPREERPVAVESPFLKYLETFSVPAFDANGTRLAVYDSDNDLVKIFRSSDLTLLMSIHPERIPTMLKFSTGGNFLIIKTYPDSLDGYRKGLRSERNFGTKPGSRHDIHIDSPEAIADSIQRAEIWNLQTNQIVHNLRCDMSITSKPTSGWFWKSNSVIYRGDRSSPILDPDFSADEKEFSMLCWDGMRQRWESKNWKRLENLPPPPFWVNLTKFMNNAQWLLDNDILSRSADGRIALLRIRQKSFGLPILYLWDRSSNEIRPFPKECSSWFQPNYALSGDGKRAIVICNEYLSHAFHVWNLELGKEMPLSNANFGILTGNVLRSDGVAISPDGKYLAVALIGQVGAVVANPLLIPAVITYNDLRIWDIERGEEMVSLPIDDLIISPNYFEGIGLAFSPDSTMLAVTGKKIQIFRVSDLTKKL